MNTINSKKQTLDLTIEDEVFEELREDFNSAVQNCMAGMVKKEVNEATITVKVNISLKDCESPRNAQGVVYIAKLPQFTYEVTRALQVKEKTAGKYDNADYELTADGDGFKMKKTQFGQMSMDDLADYGDEYHEAPTTEETAQQIEGGGVKLLGGGTEEANSDDDQDDDSKDPNAWWKNL